jgi:hypothetical protein
MCHGQGRLDPLDSVFGQGDGLEERRPHAQGMDGRAEVVPEPRPRELGRARAPAHRRRRFQDEHGLAGAAESEGGGETVGPRAHDHGVVGACGQAIPP